MPEHRNRKIVPFESFAEREVSRLRIENPLKGPKVVRIKRYLHKKMQSQWEEERKWGARPELDLRDHGVLPIDILRDREALCKGYALVGFNLHGVEKVGDFKEVQKKVRKVVKEEMKRELYLAHSSDVVDDPMIFRRDRGFWMRRTTFELFEL